MCDPATATLALTIAGTGASLVAQQQNAEAQTQYQNNLMIQRQQEMEINQLLANRSSANEQAQINQQITEKQIETSQTLTDNAIKAAEAKAAQKVASGEAGVSGLSIDNLLHNFAGKEARFADSVKQNQEGFEANAANRKDAVEAKRQGRVASLQPYIPKPVAGPDWAGAMVKIGTAGVEAWDAGVFSSPEMGP